MLNHKIVHVFIYDDVFIIVHNYERKNFVGPLNPSLLLHACQY